VGGGEVAVVGGDDGLVGGVPFVGGQRLGHVGDGVVEVA
jgi:hypothetical protein